MPCLGLGGLRALLREPLVTLAPELSSAPFPILILLCVLIGWRLQNVFLSESDQEWS